MNPNTKASKAEVRSHLNFMGGDSFDVKNPFRRLRMVAASSFFGEAKYYSQEGQVLAKSRGQKFLGEDLFKELDKQLNSISPYEWRSLSSKECMEKAIDECLDSDVEKTLEVAKILRNEDYIRVTPQVILVRAAMHKNQKGSGLVLKYGTDICRRCDEPSVGLAYLKSEYKDAAIPNSLKKLWKKVLEKMDDYSISKYRMDNHIVKTLDVVNLVHAHSQAIDKLMNGKSKQTKTWNSVMSTGKVQTSSEKKDNWEKAISNMGHMALLRNISNFEKNSVDYDLYAKKLIGGVLGGKQLPFRYYSAFKNISSAKNKDLVEECLELSLKNVSPLKGKTICLSDNSGSATGAFTSSMGQMHVCDIGNLMSVITAKISDEGYVGVFGDRLEILPVRKKSSIMDDLSKVKTLASNIGGGTENGIWLFFRDAILKREVYDRIFVYSDMQAGHGGLYGLNQNDYRDYQIGGRNINVAKLIKEYRKINPRVMVYLVQTAGYEDSLVPEYYDRTFIIGGWSDGILKFANAMEELYK